MLAATAGQAVDLTPLTDDHQAIRAAADRASQALASFRGAPGTLAELHASVSQLHDMLDEHIADEEQQILAAMRRYLPADAYRWCEQQTRRKGALPGLRFTAPWLARHAQPDELNRLLAAGGWPARIVLGRHPPPVRPAGTPGIRHVTEPSGGGMTGSTDTSPRPGGLVTGAVEAAVMIGLARVEQVYRGRRGVGFSALSGVDVAISAGEMVAITGPSGSGKSTIIKLIAGIDRPTVGTVTVSGRQLDPMTEEQLAVRRGRLRGDRNRPRPCGNRQRGALHPGRASRADRRRPHLRRDHDILRGYVTPFRLEQG